MGNLRASAAVYSVTHKRVAAVVEALAPELICSPDPPNNLRKKYPGPQKLLHYCGRWVKPDANISLIIRRAKEWRKCTTGKFPNWSEPFSLTYRFLIGHPCIV